MNPKNSQKDHLIASLQSEKLLDFIKHGIEEYLGYPMLTEGYGVYAGQFISNKVVEFLNLPMGTPYNDLDMFVPMSFRLLQSGMPSDFAKFLNDRSGESYNDLTSARRYAVDSDYGHMYLTSYEDYRIVTSLTKGKLNKTYIVSHFAHRMKSYGANNIAMNIIKQFDINSTQVGFSMAGNKLVFTEDFVEYLMTRELKIANWNTPAHSFIRLHKKYNELKNVFVNFEEQTMLAMSVLGTMRNNFDVSVEMIYLHEELKDNYDYSRYSDERDLLNGSVLSRPIFFGQKHIEHRDIYIPEHQKITTCTKGDYFLSAREIFAKERNIVLADIERLNKRNPEEDYSHKLREFEKFEESLSLETIIPEDTNYFYSQFIGGLKDTNLGREESKFLDKQILPTFERLFFMKKAHNVRGYLENKKISDFQGRGMTDMFLAEALPKIFSSIKRARKKTVKHYVNLHWLGKTEEWREYGRVALYKHDRSLFMGGMDIDSFTPQISSNKKLIDKYLTNHDISYITDTCSMEELLQIARNLQRLDREEQFFGSIYGILEKNFVAIETLKDYNSLKGLLKDLEKRQSEPLCERSIDIKEDNYRLTQLISTIELQTEGNEMSHCVGGYSGSVRSGESVIVSGFENSVRFTVELRPMSENTFGLVQVQAKGNKPVSWESVERSMYEIDKHFKIFPMSGQHYQNVFLRNASEADFDLADSLVKLGLVKKPESATGKFQESNSMYGNHFDAYNPQGAILVGENDDEIPF